MQNLAPSKLAGVEPAFAKLNGRDPLSVIVSANLARRNLTKGQQAMALAMIYPEGKKGKRSPETGHFSKQRLSDARKTLRYSSQLAQEVVAGTTSLDEALDLVRREEQRSKGKEAQLERLKTDAPDLSERVSEERLSIEEAMTLLREREARNREVRESAKAALERIGPNFLSDVTAIAAGFEAGESFKMPAQTRKIIQDAYTHLWELFERKELQGYSGSTRPE